MRPIGWLGALSSVLIGLCVVAEGCSKGEATTIKPAVVLVDGGAAWDARRLYVARGHRWVLPGRVNTRRLATDARGDRAPGDAVTLFYDTDGDEQLDPVEEPSCPCVLDDSSGTTNCFLSDSKVEVRRIRRIRDGCTLDGTFVTADAYEPTTGIRRVDVRVCADDGRCSHPARGPFSQLPVDLNMLWLCELSADEQTADRIPIDLNLTVGGDVSQVHTVQPPPVDVSAHIDQEGEAVVVRTRAANQVDRFVVWLGELDGDALGSLLWTSEQSPVNTSRLGETSVTIPASALARCKRDCVAVVQAVKFQRDGLVWSYSEMQLFLDLPVHG